MSDAQPGSVYFDGAEAWESHLREEANREAALRRPNCEHLPMKAALDDWIGCRRCGAWLERSH